MSASVEAPDPARSASPAPSRKRPLAIVVATAVLLTAGGLGAARLVKSPGEKAAEAKPPRPSVITAVVERRILSDTVVVRGRVTAGQTVTITPQGAGGKDAGAVRPVVTGIRVKSGESVKVGQVIIEISGRPLFVLPGTLPVYRDLKPGATGPDVEQLQASLAGLGHKTNPDKPGSYGEGTKKAVTAFYKALGYEAPEVGAADQRKAAEERVTQAERALSQAKDPTTPLRPDPTAVPSQGPDRDKPPADQGPAPGAAQQLRYATEDLAKAREALTELKATSGAMMPASEMVFLSAFPARVDTVKAVVGGEVKDKAMTLSTGDLVVRGVLATHERGLVRPPMQVGILSELSGIEVEGVVRSVSDEPATTDGNGEEDTTKSGTPQSGRGFEMVVVPAKPLDPKLAGQDVRLTVQAASSGGPVLVVPLSAVSAGADGRTVVTTVDTSGTQRRVEVRPGTSGDGSVEVTPLGAGTLRENDHVVVGAKPKAPIG